MSKKLTKAYCEQIEVASIKKTDRIIVAIVQYNPNWLVWDVKIEQRTLDNEPTISEWHPCGYTRFKAMEIAMSELDKFRDVRPTKKPSDLKPELLSDGEIAIRPVQGLTRELLPAKGYSLYNIIDGQWLTKPIKLCDYDEAVKWFNEIKLVG